MNETHFALDLDEFSTEIHSFLAEKQDGVAGHFARFTGTQKGCMDRIMSILQEFVEKQIYESDEYGYKIE